VKLRTTLTRCAIAFLLVASAFVPIGATPALATSTIATDVTVASSSRLLAPPTGVVLDNSFVSAVGWVKPGATYPSRVFVRNYGATGIAGASVSVAAADGMRFTKATPLAGSGTATVSATAVTWTIGSIPAATASGPTVRTLVIESKAKGTREDARIVWKDLSTVATLTYTGGVASTSRSKGPKVIPEASHFDSARYGYRPFPVVPVDYQDRKHAAAHTGEQLANTINSPSIPGSTFNLYQEMSYGQLFPEGTVPSGNVAQAGWGDLSRWHFTTATPPTPALCTGQTYQAQLGTAPIPDRIKDGWYQLPGAAWIDNACGPIGKAVYDAAHIADPEIDYSEYDTDKDGVVDFFMMVFAGVGGNGPSQRAGYDNIWPHSSSLEYYYTDPATGLTGYISSDQLRDYHERPMYYTDALRRTMTTTVTAYPVYVRVGPYNVNPEGAADHASVIAHEYGHSLGLPEHGRLLEAGAGLAHPARPQGRRDHREREGFEDQHASHRLGATRRHSVHAHRPERQQRRGIRRAVARTQDHRRRQGGARRVPDARLAFRPGRRLQLPAQRWA
jgi:immune inhibitor A